MNNQVKRCFAAAMDDPSARRPKPLRAPVRPGRCAVVCAWSALSLALAAHVAGVAGAQDLSTVDPHAGSPTCPVDRLLPGQGRLCVQLSVRDGRPFAEPGAVFVPNGLPAAITTEQVVARLQDLLRRVQPHCDPDVAQAGNCLLRSSPALRNCIGDAGAASSWVAYWTRVQETCGADADQLNQVSGLFRRLGDDSPFVSGLLDDRFEGDTGIVRLQVVALTAQTPLRIVGPLPAAVREPGLRRALAPLQDGLWSSAAIEARIKGHYQPLRLSPQVVATAESAVISVVEASRMREVALPPLPNPADAKRRRARLQALYLLLDDRDFRRAQALPGSRDHVAFVDDLGYPPCQEPFWLPDAARRQTMALSALNMDLQPLAAAARPSGDGCPEQPLLSARVVDKGDGPVAGETSGKRFIGIQLTHRPGQGTSVRGVVQQDMLALPQADLRGGLKLGREGAGDPSAQVDLTADYIAFERLRRRLSATFSALREVTPRRFLAGALRDETRRGRQAAVELEPFHQRDGQRLLLSSGWRDISVTTTDPVDSPARLSLVSWTLGADWHVERAARLLPWQLRLRPLLSWGHVRGTAEQSYRKAGLAGEWHGALPHGLAFDMAARLDAASRTTPLVEQPSLGGADSVRGFRQDDGIGARLWSLQSELWVPWPAPHGGGSSSSSGLTDWLGKLRLAPFVDVGAVSRPAAGSQSGTRRGAGLGLRLLLDPAVIKLDYGWRRGPSDSHGPTGRLYFSLGGDIPL